MAAFMLPTDALPLESIHLSILPKTTHNIAWSPDNELAIGCDDCVILYVPDFSLRVPVVNDQEGPRQYSEAALRFPTTVQKPHDLNRHLFENAGQVFKNYSLFTGAGEDTLTGHGSTLNHNVALQWSPGGLGRMSRSVLAVLTSAGIITVYCQGAPDSVASSSAPSAGSIRPWTAVWHVGAGMLVPAAEGHTAPDKRECIISFAWASGMGSKSALLAYMNTEHEVVLLRAGATHDSYTLPGHPGTWHVLEVARFVADGPHSTPADPTDPDFTYANSSFSLSWSPWLRRGSSLTCILSYVSHNYVGFRQVTIDDTGEGLNSASVYVTRADADGVCLYLSTDAFVVWEDKIWTVPGSNIVRGIIASPTRVKEFELSFDHTSPIQAHTTDKCGTAYPSQEDELHIDNPITGVIIHPPSSSQNTSTPSYTLVRLSAAHDISDWHQTNLMLSPQPEGSNNTNELTWATEIKQIIEHQLPRALAHRQGTAAAKGEDGEILGFDSEEDEEDEGDFDDSDDEDDVTSDFLDTVDGDGDENLGKINFLGLRGVDTEDQVHLNRIRIWGLTVSPGSGTSAVLISQHSNLEFERDTFAGLKCRVLFGTHGCSPHSLNGDDNNIGVGNGAVPKLLSTEARAWEWMYGGGLHVPGFSTPVQIWGDNRTTLRYHFELVAQGQSCIFCELPLSPQDGGSSSCCDNGHIFENCANTGVPILAPNVSRTCGVCGMKCLNSEELLDIAPQLKDLIERDISPELCGGCGGKFTS
ncbi:hypothetical protein F5Y08DRAFT_127512 [Xylaria arbuscula]|nr:hypothetical protein F5Y08DRAFT_127512 [Xylaria arbuscula]